MTLFANVHEQKIKCRVNRKKMFVIFTELPTCKEFRKKAIELGESPLIDFVPDGVGHVPDTVLDQCFFSLTGSANSDAYLVKSPRQILIWSFWCRFAALIW